MKPTLPHAAADLGPQVLNATVHTAVPGRGPQDGHLLYAVIDGSYDADARLAVIDLNTGGVLRELPLPGAPSSWASAAAADGTIYVGSNMNGHLYRYVPGSEAAEDLGLAVPGNSYVFALAAAEDGSVYGGTFPGAQLFRFHPDSGITLIGEGPLQEGEQYIRSLAWDAERDELYAGIGSHAHLVRYRPDDGSLAELLPEEARGQFVYNLSVAAGRLFVRVTPSRTVFVLRLADPARPSGGLELESRLEEVDSFGVSPLLEGAVYYSSGGKLYAYEPGSPAGRETGSAVPFDPIGFAQVRLADQDTYPGRTLVGVGNRSGQTCLFKFNPAASRMELEIPAVQESPTLLNSLRSGPDGLLYTSGYLVGGTGVHDPATGLTRQLRGLGQSENIAVLDGILYFGIYPGAKVYRYDPRLPWTLDQGGDNPRLLFALSGQDRPFAMTAGSDGKLYIGTAPVYGTHGGCLAVYDPVTDGLTVHDRPAGSLSLVAAVFHDGILYAGTSVWGGLGIDPVENEAGLLVFPGGEGRPELVRLGIPGLHEVSAVTLGRDGLIWGMAEGYLFTYDPSVRAVTWQTLAFPEIMSYGKHYWRDAHLLQAEDGYIYGTVRLAEALFRVDPATKEITVLDRSGAFLLCDGGNGSLYYSDAASRLKRYSLLPQG